jgi:hypothetical protein
LGFSPFYSQELLWISTHFHDKQFLANRKLAAAPQQMHERSSQFQLLRSAFA